MRNVVLVTAMVFEMMTLLSCNQKNDKSNIPINKVVSQDSMEEIYSEVKTPFKYGVVLKHADSTKLIDSPTIFRENNVWYITYIIYDGHQKCIKI